MFFDPATAKPLINSPAGVRATREHVEALKWTYPDTLSKSWPEQYANLGAGGAAMSATFSNVTKFITKGSPLDKGFGQNLRTSLAPGRMVNGRLVRRSILVFNAQFGVNAFSDERAQEAAYLTLQWASGGRVFSWMVGNPAGYFDPVHQSDLHDPVVRASYKPHAVDMLKQIIPRTAPELSGIRGANEYLQALDINLQKALSKQMSPEAAMQSTEQAWERITNRLGREKQVAALKAGVAAWPKIV
jgi:multiple sugar transport system substrate-binding protein